MRLRKVDPPFVVLHPDLMSTVEAFEFFDRNSLSAVEKGFYDSVIIIDGQGTEYSVLEVIAKPRRVLKWLPPLSQKSVDVDLELQVEQIHSVKSLIERLLGHLRQHPDWFWANEEVWNERETLQRLQACSSITDVVLNAGYYSSADP